jgi:hypothetical protein
MLVSTTTMHQQVTYDKLTFEPADATLTFASASEYDYVGWVVALSSNGSVLAIGAPGTNGDGGRNQG